MKRWLGALMGLALLASCGNISAQTKQPLTGSFRGDWRKVDRSKLQLALVGLDIAGLYIFDRQLDIQNPNPSEGYVAKLSSPSTDGTYQLVAYSDENANGRLETSDTVLGSSCHMYLLFVHVAGQYTFFAGSKQTLELQAGWSSFNTKIGRVPVQAEAFSYFDLYPNGYCPAYEG